MSNPVCPECGSIVIDYQTFTGHNICKSCDLSAPVCKFHTGKPPTNLPIIAQPKILPAPVVYATNLPDRSQLWYLRD